MNKENDKDIIRENMAGLSKLLKIILDIGHRVNSLEALKKYRPISMGVVVSEDNKFRATVILPKVMSKP